MEPPERTRRSWVADAAVLPALLWWATYLTWGTGGREPHVLSVGAALLLPALVVTRPWKRLSLPVYGVLTAVGLAAFGVALLAPTGWRGANDAASYAYAGQLAAVGLAWATGRERRLLLAGLVVAASGLEFAQGWLAWWGGQDLAHPFVGTFYWHNQAGVFLAAGTVVGCAAAASGVRGLSLLGWLLGPLSAAGVLFSTSRASTIAAALGVVLVALVPGARGRLRHLAAVGGFAGACVAMSLLLSSRLFFPHATKTGLSAATAAEAARGHRESFSGNGVQRFEDWRRALAIFMHWPLTGAGFHSFDSASGVAATRHDGVRTAFAHNGFLQVLSDGGLLLTVPVGLALALAGWWLLRSLRAAWHRRDVVALGGAAALAVLVLHSGMDFDWSYPALLAGFVLVLVLSLDPLPAGTAGSGHARQLLAYAGSVVLVLAVVGAWGGGLALNVTVGGAT